MNAEELELRLSVDPTNISRLRRLSVLSESAVGRPRTERQKSIYFDTPDRDLERANVTLRVREIGRRRLQTAKIGNGFHAGAAQRAEYESWIAGDRPDLAVVADTPLADLVLRNKIVDRLAPAFETDVRRTTRVLRYRAPDGTEAEIAADLDIGEIRSGEATTPIAELELELKQGSPRVLYDLALIVNERVPVRIGHLSKAARANNLAAGALPGPVRAEKLRLPADIRLDRAAALVIANCHDQIAGNELAVLTTEEPEGPHQMRVGLRRLRAALTLFQPVLPAEEVLPLREELRWAASSLGEAREWDVFVRDLLNPVRGGLGEHIGLAALADLAEERRQSGYAAAREAVASQRFTRVQLLIGRMVEGLRERAESTGSMHLARAGDFAAARLEQRYTKIVKRGRRMLRGNALARHDLRLQFKKMRYASEFFAALFDRAAAKKFARAAADVQDLLGYANDLAVAEDQVERLVSAGPKARQQSLALAAGVLVGWHGREMVDAEPKIKSAWQRFVKQGRFWPKPEG